MKNYITLRRVAVAVLATGWMTAAVAASIADDSSHEQPKRFILSKAAGGPNAPAGAVPEIGPLKHVWVKGHKAHPVRMLARLKANPKADPAALLQQSNLAVAHRFSVPGLVLLDAADGKVPSIATDADSRKQGAALLHRIKQFQETGLFEFVEPDYIVSLDAEPTDSAFINGTLWGLKNTGQSGGMPGADINVTQAWDLTTGSTNVIVAVIDTGIRYTHADLAAQMWRNPGEIPGNGLDDDGNGYVDDIFGINAITGSGNPMDDNNHGTHVAGTIGAAANDGNPHVGVVWQVRLMACKFLSAGGSGTTSDAIKCIDYAVAKGARILNNSWGGGAYSQALFNAIATAQSQGVLFVAAAGNNGRNTDSAPHYPSSYAIDNVASVAALHRTNLAAGFSTFRTPAVGLGAPGVSIYSATAGSDTEYQLFNGTSMAAPHVSGVAALVASRFPGVGLIELRQRLLATTTAAPALSGKTATGGRVNAFNALTAVPDGILEITMASADAVPLPAGRTTAVFVAVSDLFAVTNASVIGNVTGGGTLTFFNNGIAPDVVANDHIHTASFAVPTNTNSVTLLIQVSAPGMTNGSNSVTWPVITPPPNDMFVAGIAVTGSSNTVFGSNLGATSETGEPLHAGVSGGKSVWWTWTAPTSGNVTMNTAGSNFDTLLAVYTGASVSALMPVASNDDSGSLLTSSVTFSVLAGTAYHIAVDGYAGASGSITLNVIPTTSPPNDMFVAGIAVTGSSNTVFGSNLGATSETGEPLHAGVSGGKSVWWTWTAPTSGNVTMNTAGSNFDTLLAVYTGASVSALMPVASNDDSGSLLTSSVTFSVLAGTAYHIAVDGYAGASGSITLAIDASPPSPPAILQHPQNQTAPAGGNATFSVQASGATPLSYQWRFNGANIAGATASALGLANLSSSNAGNYSVLITNSLGSVASSNALLTVMELTPILFDDFEPGIDASQWSAFGGTVLATNHGGFVTSPNSLWFGGNGSRFATTRAIDTLSGGAILFHLSLSDGNAFPWERVDLPAEAVVLEYSVNGGGTWITLATYNTSSFFNWGLQQAILPSAAQSSATLFRWRQVTHSGDCCDHWALDNVRIGVLNAPPPAIQAGTIRYFSDSMEFQFAGRMGHGYSIQASSNLVHWWTLTNLVGNGSGMVVRDGAAGGWSNRYYRIVSP